MEENFVRRKLPHTYRIFYEVLPVFEWTNNSVSQMSSPVRRLTVLASSLVTAQPLRQTWIRLPPTGTTTSPPLSLQGSLLILLPSLQSTLSPFLFFTPVSSFSATPRGNDYWMHENGKEFSGAQKITKRIHVCWNFAWGVWKRLLHCILLGKVWTAACQAPLSMGILQARVLEWGAIAFSRD